MVARALTVLLFALLVSGCSGYALCNELPPRDTHPLCVDGECAWPYKYGRKIF